MTGSALGRWTLRNEPVAVLFIDKGEEFEEGEWSPFCGTEGWRIYENVGFS